ncbi:MAG: copper chaperone [Rhodobacteraceae bacterium]|mgnify:CR=1 FL=1|jgi:copper chaperone|uniref:Copper chaperone n=1 Tax=Salipiger profundus TaxID=1229727 RepID=A0A1U7D2N3_9RHOB|nr:MULTISPECIES: heavy-metal-associated domain-containing protein [Salipiger]APX22382.1 copper chaperone [Salipiger profundus]MAB05666.1 copper chaperone [Paracoccaceae bacterium]GGA22840.1 heavy metal transport/detoxification protein [Salipiger profundus]SFD65342.1 copper chaperone [Salipiger profundus]
MSTYKVEDMSCGHCVSTIETAVSKADPSAQATCDLSSKTVEITGAKDEAAVVQAVREAGYEPSPA